MRARLLGPALALVVSACVGGPDLGSTHGDVIGGTRTPDGMFPGVGALYLPSFGGAMCTGTLIAPDVVLTAAHCVEPAFLGSEIPGFTLAHDTVVSQPAFVTGMRAVQHPVFDINNDPGVGIGTWYDIALLFLTEPILDVEPVKLPSTAEGAMLAPGSQLELVGYGQTIDGDPGSIGVMFNATAPVVMAGVAELQISNPGDPQNCYGDSGGPALIDFGGGYRVVGVVSRSADGSDCTQGGVDTRVDAYLNFIAMEGPEICVPGTDRCTPDAAPALPDAGGPGVDGDGGGCCSTSRGAGAGSLVMAVFVGLVTLRRRRS